MHDLLNLDWSNQLNAYLTKATQNGTKDCLKLDLKYKLDFSNIQWNFITYLSCSPYDFTNFQSWSIFSIRSSLVCIIVEVFFVEVIWFSLKNHENSELGNWATMLWVNQWFIKEWSIIFRLQTKFEEKANKKWTFLANVYKSKGRFWSRNL